MDNLDEGMLICGLEYEELVKAAEHLNRALELLLDVNEKVIDGDVVFIDIVEKLTEAWNEVNNCRVFTEKIVDFEELLVPAMGYVNDARMMMESLVCWKLGMTMYGKISILTSIREAVTSGIGPGIIMLESCMDPA